MNTENFEILEEMLCELEHEYQDIKKKQQANLLRIEEAKLYLKSMLDKEDADFKIFSPRNIETVHKDEIDRVTAEMNLFEKENEQLTLTSQKLIDKIKKLETFLKDAGSCSVNSLNILEDERLRISRDLHDTSLQNLAHLVHKIELSSMFIDQDPLRAKLELSLVSKSLKSVIEEVRNIIFNLRPMEFDDLGLKAAFERLVSLINVDKKYEIDFYVQDVSCENNIVLLTLYRAVQECFTNIVKHAEATKIIFHGEYVNGMYCINIKDNGKGFTQEDIEKKKNSHFGMSLMKERIKVLNGEVDITPCEQGVNVEIRIPVKEDLIIR